MDQFGRGFDFPVKALDGIWVFHPGGGQDLNGYGPLHAAVLGLEHHSHPTGADTIHDNVLAENECPLLPLIDDLGLVPGELALENEQLSQAWASLGRWSSGRTSHSAEISAAETRPVEDRFSTN
jgi:hypothetical protein